MTHAVCPGSFDPPTLGHLDVIGRVAGLFDRVTVAVLVNPDKQRHVQHCRATRTAPGDAPPQWPNVSVDSFQGLLVDYCTANGIGAIVKGLRAVSDFDYELQMAQMNHGLTGVRDAVPADQPELLVCVVIAGQAGRQLRRERSTGCCRRWSPRRFAASWRPVDPCSG